MMSSRVLFSLVLLLISTAIALPASGQILRGFGVKGGVTSSAVRSPDLEFGGQEPIVFDTKRRTGVVALAYLEWLDLPTISIMTEAGYAQRGYATEHEGRDEQNNPIGTIRYTTKFDYVSLSVQAKVRVPNGSYVPYAVAGPRLDIFIGGDPNEEGTLASWYSPTAFGGTVGVGLEALRLLPVRMFAEIRYSFDVTDSLPDVPREAYNNAADLIVGVSF